MTDACELSGKAAGCPEGARAASGCGARGLPCSGAPLLVLPSLAAAESDGVDGTSLKYLLKLALKERGAREEEAGEVLAHLSAQCAQGAPHCLSGAQDHRCLPVPHCGRQVEEEEEEEKEAP